MRKIWCTIILFLSVSFCIHVGAYMQPEVTGEMDVITDDWTMMFQKYEIIEDSDGNAAIALIYNYTNNSSEPEYASSLVDFENYQSGRNLHETFPVYGSEYDELFSNTREKIKDGATLKIAFVYELVDEQNNIEIGIESWEAKIKQEALVSFNGDVHQEEKSEDTTNAESSDAAYLELDKANIQISELKKEIETLTKSLDKSEKEKKELEEKLESLRRSFDTLQDIYNKQKEELENAKNQLAELSSGQEKPQELSQEQVTEQDTEEPTAGEKNALGTAKKYLSIMAFSKQGLKDQLEYEGFSDSEADYAVNNVEADWNEQAFKSAQKYLELMEFSLSGLIDQLVYDGFTQEEAEYGANKAYN